MRGICPETDFRPGISLNCELVMINETTWTHREQVHAECSRVTSSLLLVLSEAMNGLHGTDYSVDYWELILGFWTRSFVDLVSSRNEEILGGTYIDVGSSTPPPVVSRASAHLGALNRQSQSAEWNRQLASDIQTIRDRGQLDVLETRDSEAKSVGGSSRIRRAFLESTKSMSVRLASRLGVVIASSYLPSRAELSLALSLRSVPVRWPQERVFSTSENSGKRQQLSSLLRNHAGQGFEAIVVQLLPWYLPMSFLEDFTAIRSRVCRGRAHPGVIFTANLHCSSDSFVIWAAEQRARAATLMISQHGGLNGQGRLPTRGQEFEQQVADRYLHWGWAEGEKSRLVPAQIVAWKKKRKTQPSQGSLLLVTDATFRHNRRPWAGIEDHGIYLEMLFSAYGGIPEEIKKQTVIRLHKDHALYDDNHEAKWRARHPDCNLDSGFGPMAELVDSAQLVVCTTLGTTEIEQFTRNVPTILRLDRHVHALRSSEEALFAQMEKAGLVHYSTESLTAFLNDHWENLEGWWSSTPVVRVVSAYLNRFGHRSHRPVRDFRKVLKEV